MKTLEVEFRPRASLPRWAWIALVGAMLAASGGVSILAWHSWGDFERVRAQLAHRQARMDAASAAATRQQPARVAAAHDTDARAVVRAAGFDWAGVFAAIESPRVPGASVAALEANAVDAVVRIELDTLDQATLLRYLDDLNAGESARRWRLAQMRLAANGKSVSSTLEAQGFGP